MIDEKKIEEAENSSAEQNRWEVAFSDDEVRTLCKKLLIAGAHWVIQEFLKVLWHDANEEPSRYDDYLVITKQGCIDSCYFDADSWHDPKIGGGNVTMWLDYKDILPKQKGDKND